MSVSSSPLVSVVIPAYNAMVYLPEALESVLQQTFLNFEVVIVNDGSDDGIKDWAAELKDARVRLVSQENRGLAGARNRGIQESRGEYLAFLDADDCWHPTKLAKQVEVLTQSPTVGVVYTWMQLIDPAGDLTGRTVKNCVEGFIWSKLILRNCVGSGSTPMVRRECFERVGVFDENLGSYMEDRDMWLRLAPHYEFAVVKELLVNYRQHPASASKNWEKMARSARIILDKSFETAPSHLSQAEVESLRDRAYGLINLSLAWKPLQSKHQSYRTSLKFLGKALRGHPAIFLSRDFWRLLMTMAALRLLGNQGYLKLLQGVFFIRRQALQNMPFRILMAQPTDGF